jgi:oligopeptide/dipeptide ABC transporter ATP-binding protein
VMYLGKVVEFGEAEAVCSNPRHPYTAALLSSIPEIRGDHAPVDRILLRGEAPSPMDPPSGCRFRTRCNFARPDCELREPSLVDGPVPHVACHYPLPEVHGLTHGGSGRT